MSLRAVILYISPWSLKDPLCQSQSLSYLKKLTDFGYKFALITFENSSYKLTPEEETAVKNDLAGKGIFWHPVVYRKGNSALGKFREFFDGFITGVKAVRQHRPQIVHSRSSLPVGVALTLSKIFRLKYLYDADSVLSEEYAEIGHWSRDGFSYKTTVRMENAARRQADEIVVLTETLRRDFRAEYNVKAPIEVIPCCIDTEKFKPNESARKRRRAELGIEDEKLLVYVGKYGKRYLVEETFAFFKVFNQKIPSSRFLIVSREERDVFAQIARNSGVSDDHFSVKSGSSDEVAEWLSAADAGLCLIRQMKSERGSSPIKFSEYLSAGLPVVITENIGDCSRLTEDEKIGVVLPSLDAKGYDYGAERLQEIFDADGANISVRCRNAAQENFSLETVGAARYRKIYERLLGE